MIELCRSISCCIDPVLIRTAAHSECGTAGGEDIQRPNPAGEELQQMCVFQVFKCFVSKVSQKETENKSFSDLSEQLFG